jgi:hypothetical protein
MRRLKHEHADMAEELQMIHQQQNSRNETEQAKAEIGQQRNFIILRFGLLDGPFHRAGHGSNEESLAF